MCQCVISSLPQSRSRCVCPYHSSRYHTMRRNLEVKVPQYVHHSFSVAYSRDFMLSIVRKSFGGRCGAVRGGRTVPKNCAANSAQRAVLRGCHSGSRPELADPSFVWKTMRAAGLQSLGRCMHRDRLKKYGSCLPRRGAVPLQPGRATRR